MTTKEVFRKRSLERLSSPENLDQLMLVTTSRAWLLLVALCSLLAVGVVWSAFGRLATKVHGVGILIKSGGVLDIVSLGAGQITALYIQVGDDVDKGQIVARIAQPELTQQLEKARARLEEAESQTARIASLGSEETKVQYGYEAQQRANLRDQIRADRERSRWLADRRRQQERLFRQGLVTKQALEATKLEIQSTREEAKRARNELASLTVSSQAMRSQREKEALAGRARISESQREVDILEERLEQTSRVISPHSGRVLEVRASEGDVVRPGRPILNLEPAGTESTGLEALIYVPLSQGKSLRPGMRVQIAPDSVRKEEYGVMVGIVTSVAEFPSTEDGMRRILGNNLLVQNLLQSVGLAPIAVQAELVPDAHTPSGYKWSSNRGPPGQFGPGTPCRASISVRQTRPIELVIPLMREYLGV